MNRLGFSRIQKTYAPLRHRADLRVLWNMWKNLRSFYREQNMNAPPMGVAWELTYNCDCHCLACATHRVGRLRRDLSPEAAIEIAQKIGKAGVPFVTLTGGEPLISKCFLPVVETLHQYGVKILLSTNGSRLEEMSASLQDLGIHTVTISLDSLNPHRHDRMRGYPGLYKKVERGVGALKSHDSKKRPLIRLRFLVTPENFQEMVPFSQYWRPLVDDICFQPIQRVSQGHVHNFDDDRLLFSSPEQREPFANQMALLMSRFPEFDTLYYRRMMEYLFKPSSVRNQFLCLVPAMGFMVAANGDVQTCADASHAIGNLLRDDPLEVWNQKEFRTLRWRCLNRCRDCLCWMQPQTNEWIPSWLEFLMRFGP